jgi:uncharacterized membrane protein required for colicin V production
MFDPALFASMTWLDWAIVGVPALFVLFGLIYGGTGLLLFGLVRFFTALPLAAAPAAYVVTQQKQMLGEVARMSGLTPPVAAVVVGSIVFLVALIVIYRVLGLIWGALRSVLSSSTIGVALDRLVGIPLGAVVGAYLGAMFVVVPAVQFRATTPQPDQPAALRNSVLMPMVEEQIRELMRHLPAPN